MTLRAVRSSAALVSGMELDFDLHLAFGAGVRVRGRVTGVRRPYIGIDWVDAGPATHRALSDYLLATDATLTPARLRAAGLAVGSIERAVTYDYATTPRDHEEVLALRLRAHQAQGHLEAASVADLRSPFDAHSRHLTCRFGGRIVGYVRVIFVDGVPAKSQYVSWGGHEVPPWLWNAGFVEAGAGAMDPEFQKAGLFVPLMAHAVRVAVQSGPPVRARRVRRRPPRHVPRDGLHRARGADSSSRSRAGVPLAPARARRERSARHQRDRGRRRLRRPGAGGVMRDVTTYRPVFVEPGELSDVVVVDELRAQLEQLARARAAGAEPAAGAVDALLDGARPGDVRRVGLLSVAPHGSCTCCPRTCTASCAWTATATRSPRTSRGGSGGCASPSRGCRSAARW